MFKLKIKNKYNKFLLKNQLCKSSKNDPFVFAKGKRFDRNNTVAD
jgi:hypothetical protein